MNNRTPAHVERAKRKHDFSQRIRAAIYQHSTQAEEARKIGVCGQKVQGYTDPDTDECPPASDLPAFSVPIALDLVRWVLERITDGVKRYGIVELPDHATGKQHDAAHLAQAVRETGEACAEFASVIAAGGWTPAMAANVARECDQGVAALLALREHARIEAAEYAASIVTKISKRGAA